MKITVTGSLGNISKPLTKQLIAAGHQVTVISSSPDKTAAIAALGATAAIGSLTDAAFLTKAFTGADAVYTMVPPNFAAADYRENAKAIAHSYATAINNTGITRIVNLSSVGADLENGTGQITGLHDTELILNQLEGVAIKHIRAGYFYVNFLSNIGMIKHLGFIGSNYDAKTRIVMVHPENIADVIAEEIQQPITGKSVRYAISDDRTTSEVAALLGAAIGKPDLQWVEFTDEQALDGMLQAGVPPVQAKGYVEMGTAIRSGALWTDYDLQHTIKGNIKLEDFAKEFAAKFV